MCRDNRRPRGDDKVEGYTLLQWDYCTKYWTVIVYKTPMPLAERSKAWICSRSHAGIADSNPAGGMDVCLL